LDIEKAFEASAIFFIQIFSSFRNVQYQIRVMLLPVSRSFQICPGHDAFRAKRVRGICTK